MTKNICLSRCFYQSILSYDSLPFRQRELVAVLHILSAQRPFSQQPEENLDTNTVGLFFRDHAAFTDVIECQNHTAPDFQPLCMIGVITGGLFGLILTSSSSNIFINSPMNYLELTNLLVRDSIDRASRKPIRNREHFSR